MNEYKSYEKDMVENYNKYFRKLYNNKYWLVVVKNHFDIIYSIFVYAKKVRGGLEHSWEIVHFPQDQELYDQLVGKLKSISKLPIEYRDTHHLVHPGEDTKVDLIHGHGQSTKYTK